MVSVCKVTRVAAGGCGTAKDVAQPIWASPKIRGTVISDVTTGQSVAAVQSGGAENEQAGRITAVTDTVANVSHDASPTESVHHPRGTHPAPRLVVRTMKRTSKATRTGAGEGRVEKLIEFRYVTSGVSENFSCHVV